MVGRSLCEQLVNKPRQLLWHLFENLLLLCNLILKVGNLIQPKKEENKTVTLYVTMKSTLNLRENDTFLKNRFDTILHEKSLSAGGK